MQSQRKNQSPVEVQKINDPLDSVKISLKPHNQTLGDNQKNAQRAIMNLNDVSIDSNQGEINLKQLSVNLNNLQKRDERKPKRKSKNVSQTRSDNQQKQQLSSTSSIQIQGGVSLNASNHKRCSTALGGYQQEIPKGRQNYDSIINSGRGVFELWKNQRNKYNSTQEQSMLSQEGVASNQKINILKNNMFLIGNENKEMTRLETKYGNHEEFLQTYYYPILKTQNTQTTNKVQYFLQRSSHGEIQQIKQKDKQQLISAGSLTYDQIEKYIQDQRQKQVLNSRVSITQENDISGKENERLADSSVGQQNLLINERQSALYFGQSSIDDALFNKSVYSQDKQKVDQDNSEFEKINRLAQLSRTQKIISIFGKTTNSFDSEQQRDSQSQMRTKNPLLNYSMNYRQSRDDYDELISHNNKFQILKDKELKKKNERLNMEQQTKNLKNNSKLNLNSKNYFNDEFHGEQNDDDEEEEIFNNDKKIINYKRLQKLSHNQNVENIQNSLLIMSFLNQNNSKFSANQKFINPQVKVYNVPSQESPFKKQQTKRMSLYEYKNLVQNGEQTQNLNIKNLASQTESNQLLIQGRVDQTSRNIRSRTLMSQQQNRPSQRCESQQALKNGKSVIVKQNSMDMRFIGDQIKHTDYTRFSKVNAQETFYDQKFKSYF